MPDLTVLTVGGDRPECLALLEKYMARQTTQDFEWLLVDDGQEPMTPTMGQKHVVLPHEESPHESFRKNMLVGLTSITSKAILFCEIDDWYAPGYVEEQSEILRYKQLSGRTKAKYYHVRARKWMIHPNLTHASLSQTGISGAKVKQVLVNYLSEHSRPAQADGFLWRRAGLGGDIKSIIPGGTQTVSIKGMPGRAGLGIHHREEELEQYEDDSDCQQLRRWIQDDADHYTEYFKPGESG